MSQRERVLAASRRFNGVCQAEFLAPDVIDGGKPITRVAARIDDLETKHKCVFEVIGWRKSTKVYRLLSEPDSERCSPTAADPPVSLAAERVPSPRGASPSAGPERLFDAPASIPHYQDAA